MKTKNGSSLENTTPAFRRRMIYALKADGASEHFDLFCAILQNDESPVIRHEAAFILGSSRNSLAAKPLIRAIKEDQSDLVKHEAIEALGDLGVETAEIIELLTNLTMDKNLFIKDTAEIALATLLAE